jgi:hypothetical protein
VSEKSGTVNYDPKSIAPFELGGGAEGKLAINSPYQFAI